MDGCVPGSPAASGRWRRAQAQHAGTAQAFQLFDLAARGGLLRPARDVGQNNFTRFLVFWACNMVPKRDDEEEGQALLGANLASLRCSRSFKTVVLALLVCTLVVCALLVLPQAPGRLSLPRLRAMVLGFGRSPSAETDAARSSGRAVAGEGIPQAARGGSSGGAHSSASSSDAASAAPPEPGLMVPEGQEEAAQHEGSEEQQPARPMETEPWYTPLSSWQEGEPFYAPRSGCTIHPDGGQALSLPNAWHSYFGVCGQAQVLDCSGPACMCMLCVGRMQVLGGRLPACPDRPPPRLPAWSFCPLFCSALWPDPACFGIHCPPSVCTDVPPSPPILLAQARSAMTPLPPPLRACPSFLMSTSLAAQGSGSTCAERASMTTGEDGTAASRRLCMGWQCVGV